MIKTALSTFLSLGLQILGKLTNSKTLFALSVRLDPWNLRAKRWLFRSPKLERDQLFAQLTDTLEIYRTIQIDCSVNQPELGRCLRSLVKSEAQLFQDIFVLQQLNFKRGGYFVEIGVGNGKSLSNTYLLETEFGWKGILAEPNKEFIRSIKAVRAAVLDERAVYSESGKQLDFLADTVTGEISTLSRFRDQDHHSRQGSTYQVTTVSINDLLAQNNAPAAIDYLSIDTEGSELEILAQLDFARYRFSVLTIEHNNVARNREAICALLEKNGYILQAAAYSKFDAWFVAKEIAAGL